MWGIVAAVQYRTPFMFTSIIWSHSLTLRFLKKLSGMRPALFIKISIVPHFFTTASTKESQSDFFVTSNFWTKTSPPFFAIWLFNASSLSVRRAPIATFAPAFESASAVASPIPLLAPVTTATLSLIILVSVVWMVVLCFCGSVKSIGDGLSRFC